MGEESAAWAIGRQLNLVNFGGGHPGNPIMFGQDTIDHDKVRTNQKFRPQISIQQFTKIASGFTHHGILQIGAKLGIKFFVRIGGGNLP